MRMRDATRGASVKYAFSEISKKNPKLEAGTSDRQGKELDVTRESDSTSHTKHRSHRGVHALLAGGRRLS